MKLFLIFILSLFMSDQITGQGQITKIYLIRHAEKDTFIATDPPLSATGMTRSIKLALLLGDIPVEKIFATKSHRTQQTVEPLSRSKSLEIQIYDSNDSTSIQDLFDQVRFKTSVIAGHSNTIPQIVNALIGQERYVEMDENEYSKIWILIFNKVKLVDCSVLNY